MRRAKEVVGPGVDARVIGARPTAGVSLPSVTTTTTVLNERRSRGEDVELGPGGPPEHDDQRAPTAASAEGLRARPAALPWPVTVDRGEVLHDRLDVADAVAEPGVDAVAGQQPQVVLGPVGGGDDAGRGRHRPLERLARCGSPGARRARPWCGPATASRPGAPSARRGGPSTASGRGAGRRRPRTRAARRTRRPGGRGRGGARRCRAGRGRRRPAGRAITSTWGKTVSSSRGAPARRWRARPNGSATSTVERADGDDAAMLGGQPVGGPGPLGRGGAAPGGAGRPGCRPPGSREGEHRRPARADVGGRDLDAGGVAGVDAGRRQRPARPGGGSGTART